MMGPKQTKIILTGVRKSMFRFLIISLISTAQMLLLFTPASANLKEIKVGMSAPLSGPASALGQGMRSGIESYFDKVNRQGGINGQKLRLLCLDDGYVPKTAVKNMHRLIDEEKVIALIGNVGTPTAMATVPIANQKKTLLFGAFTGADVLRKSPPDRYVINYRASYAEETAAMVKAISQNGIRPKEIAFFTQDDSYGDSGFEGATKELKKMGFTDVGSLAHGRYKRNTLNIDDALKVILTAQPRPKAIIMVGTYMPAARFIKRVKKYLHDAVFLNVSFVGSVALAKALGGEGEGVIVTQVTPHFNSGLPIIKEYRRDLKSHSKTLQPCSTSLEGYISSRIFVEGVKRVRGQLTRESIINSIERIRNFDPGIGYNLSYSKTDHQSSHRVWPTMISKGQIVPIDWAVIKSRTTKNFR